MDATARLLAEREIEAVLVDYCRHLDAMELPWLAALFTEDALVVYGPDPRLEARGRAGIEASLARMWRWRRTAHHLSNVRMWLDGAEAARAESAVWAWHEAADGSEAWVYGVYRDRLVRGDGGWRIAERRMEMRGASGGFRVPITPAWRAPPPEGWVPPEGLDG